MGSRLQDVIRCGLVGGVTCVKCLVYLCCVFIFQCSLFVNACVINLLNYLVKTKVQSQKN